MFQEAITDIREAMAAHWPKMAVFESEAARLEAGGAIDPAMLALAIEMSEMAFQMLHTVNQAADRRLRDKQLQALLLQVEAFVLRIHAITGRIERLAYN